MPVNRRDSGLPGSPSMDSLTDPAWRAAYAASQGVPTGQSVTVASTLRPSVAAHMPASAGAAASKADLLATLQSRRAQLTSLEAAGKVGLTPDQKLIASTAPPRLETMVAGGDLAKLGVVGDPVLRASALYGTSKTLFKPSPLFENFRKSQRFFEMFRTFERQQAMFRQFRSFEPIPGLAGSLIHPLLWPTERILLPKVEPLPVPDLDEPLTLPQADAVVAEIQAEATEWLADYCAKVVERLEGAHDAIRRGKPEAFAQGVTSCRRSLEALADHVYPPVEGILVPDRTGVERKIGKHQWKNRLILFIEDETTSKSTRRANIRELENLVDRIDLLVPKLGKGVHHEVTRGEAQRVYLSTWQIVSEVVLLAR